ncbi:MAG: hypothetical protein R3D44_04725 [Hyphomicrobiaceae bacterium]
MRSLALTLTLAVAMLLPAMLDASAQYRDRGHRGYDRDRYDHQRRTSTMDRQGRCVRDNGRPMDSLDLNNRCDREEFWARFNDMGDNRR